MSRVGVEISSLDVHICRECIQEDQLDLLHDESVCSSRWPKYPTRVNRSAPRNIAEGRAALQSRTQGNCSEANTNAPARQKRNIESSS